MSMADLKAFAKKCAVEKKIGDKAKKIGTDNIDGLAKYAGELGYTITQKELENLKGRVKGDALTDDQLSAISGGTGDPSVKDPWTQEEMDTYLKSLDPSQW